MFPRISLFCVARLHTSARAFARSRVPRVPLFDFEVPADSGASGASYAGARRVPGSSSMWTASMTVRGKRVSLGNFSSAKEASDAAAAAAAAARDADTARGAARGVLTRAEAAARGLSVFGDDGEEVVEVAGGEPAAAVNPSAASSRFRGVVREGQGATLWEAVYRGADGRVVSGGEYETEDEAARAHDALLRMYGGDESLANFSVDAYSAWVPPEDFVVTGSIATRPGEALTVDEIVAALRDERAVDVRVVPLAGRSDLAEALIVATGRSVAHMRKLADLVARALRKRALPGVDAGVEARDMDDWMIVDCGSVIVNIMDAETREALALEDFYEAMVEGQDPYAGMTYEEWLEANPIPDKWLARLERDEREMEAAQRVHTPPLAGGETAETASPDFTGKVVPRKRRRNKSKQ